MIKRVFAFKYAEGQPVDVMEHWYLDQHTQVAKKMPGIVRYVTYKAIPGTEMDIFPTPKFYRWTEIWWENIESLQRALVSKERQATLEDNLLPGGRSKFSYFRSATVGECTDILDPDRNNMDDTALRGKPAVKSLFIFNYAQDTPLEASERWYFQQHTQLARKMSGLMRYVTYKALASPADAEPGFFRLTELWWKDIEAAQEALYSPRGVETGKDNLRPDGSFKLNANTPFHKGPALVGFPVDIV